MRNLILILLCFSSVPAICKFSGPFPDSPDFPVIVQQAYKRLTGMDMISLMGVPVKCKAISLDNKTALADIDVLSGFSYATTINPGFWKWHYDCIDIYAKNSLLTSEAGFKKSLGAIGAQHFSKKTLQNIKETVWQDVPVEVRTAIARSIINTVIRDDLLVEFGAKPENIVKEIEGVLNHPSRSQFKVDQAVMAILQIVFKQEAFILE